MSTSSSGIPPYGIAPRLIDAGNVFTLTSGARRSAGKTIIGLVAAGLGMSILQASCERIRVGDISYVPLADLAAMSEVHVVRRRDDRSPLVA